MFLLLNVQVFSRYLSGRSLTWTEELSTIFFVWLGYLGASAAVFKKQHLRIDIVLNLFKGTAKKVVLIITDLVTMAFCIIMVKPLIDIIQHLSKLHTTTLMLRIPKDLIYWVLPFALVLTTIRFAQEIVHITRSMGEEATKTIGETIFDGVDGENSHGGKQV